jgi:hypothetical protein
LAVKSGTSWTFRPTPGVVMIPEPGLTTQTPFSSHWMSEYGCSMAIMARPFSPMEVRRAKIGCRISTIPPGPW